MNKTLLCAVIVIAMTVMAGGANYALRKQYEREVCELKQELAHATQFVPMERDTVILHTRDTVEVATSAVVTAELGALRRQHIIDVKTIEDLGLRLKQLEAVQTTAVLTSDTVHAQYQPRDSIFTYHDAWADLSLKLKDTIFCYNIRDSLTTVVYHEYRHRFLWWRWGVKGYKLKIMNFNPHSTIRYNTFVMPGK